MDSLKPLAGRVAVITGAGRGIGRATAQLLSQEGATVVLTARSEAELQEVAATLSGEVRVLAGDITSEAFVERLFAQVKEEFGHLDFLVNNAGTYVGGPIEEVATQRVRDCLELNVVAAYACMQAAIRIMRGKDEGKVLNIGSVRSHWTEGGDCGAYNASKVAIRALTESVARQLHGSGSRIAVGMVCPGIVDTSLTNPGGEPRPDWLQAETVAQAILHALKAPAGVNVFDTVLFPLSQRPW